MPKSKYSKLPTKSRLINDKKKKHSTSDSSISTCMPCLETSSGCSSSGDKKCCDKLAKIIGFKKPGVCLKDNVCLINGQREIKSEIYCPEKSKIRSPLTKAVSISFENNNCKPAATSKYLNLLQISLSQEEINPLIKELIKRKISITALNNHEILTNPTHMYLYASSEDEPNIFAKKLHFAFKCAINPCTKKSILETLQ